MTATKESLQKKTCPEHRQRTGARQPVLKCKQYYTIIGFNEVDMRMNLSQ